MAGVAALLLIYSVVQRGLGDVSDLGDTSVVRVGPVDVPISQPEPVAVGPDRFLGLVGPEPSFDTSDLGPDLSFQLGEPDFSQHEDEDILRAVYLGNDVNGHSYWIYGP